MPKMWYQGDVCGFCECMCFVCDSGEVRLVNFGSESEPLLASSGLSEVGHKEPVAKVYDCSF